MTTDQCEYVDPLGKRCGHAAEAHISPALDLGLPYANYCAECQVIPDPVGPQFIHDYVPPTPTSSLEEARKEVREAVGALIMNPMGVPETQRYAAAVLAVESAIRAPYEDFKRIADDAISLMEAIVPEALATRSEAANVGVQSVARHLRKRFNEALESLGGRK